MPERERDNGGRSAGGDDDTFVPIPHLGGDVITKFAGGAEGAGAIGFEYGLFAGFAAAMAKGTRSGAGAIVPMDASNKTR